MKITDEQLHHLRASFKQYDLNGDGRIDKSELLHILKELKVSDPEKEATVVMSKLDSDGDGSINFSEFLKSLRKLTVKEVEVDDIVAELTSSHDEKTPDKKVEPIDEPPIVLEPGPVIFTPPVVEPHPVKRGSPHLFVWRYEGSKVDLAGDFTNWGSGRLPMQRDPINGFFELEVVLGAGVYEYRFIIDNNIEWYYDILEPNVLNTGSGFINNVITV